MNNRSVSNGVMAGLALIVISLVFYFINPKILLGWAGSISWLVIIYFMYKAVAGDRAENGGGISFGEAFKSSFLVYLVATLISTIFTYVLINFIDTGMLDLIKETQMEAMDKMSGFLGEEATAEAKAELEKQGGQFGIGTSLMGWLFGLIFGAIIALIVAAVMKKDGGNHYQEA